MAKVLDTVREILKFKDYATIAEIAKISGIPQKKVLEVLNTNGQFVWRNRNNGRITKVDPRTKLKEKFVADGLFYWTTEGNYGSWTNLKFCGHDDLRKEMEIEDWEGGFGDCYKVTRIPDTPENRAKLENVGCVEITRMTLDDRLWRESE